MIHPTAIIDANAKIAANVTIGPWTVIGPEVEIGEGCVIAPHVVINGPTKIGKNNQFFQFSSIGEVPQDLKFNGERTCLEIGDNNIFRECTTINRGTGVGGGLTKIGNNNLFMAYVHIAHDCVIANHCIFANNASLSGHVVVDDYVNIGGFAAAHQFTFIGAYSFIGGNTMVRKDVLPYLMISGDPAEPYGLNVVGLQRRGFTADMLSNLRRAYRTIFRSNLSSEEALRELETTVKECTAIQLFIDGLKRSERGFIRETRRNKTERVAEDE